MREKYWLDGMMGLVVGDALGLPVQFRWADEIANRPEGPVKGMEGHGTFDMPAGSWSDDSSMALATLDSINELGKLDAGDVMINFIKWLCKNEYTPTGMAYDNGNTCTKAIYNFMSSPNVNTCGITGEYANGNGSLMRIMPVCLYAYEKSKNNKKYSDKDAINDVHKIGSLTHNHLRSNMGCGFYYFMTKAILDNKDRMTLQKCLQLGIDEGCKFYGNDISNIVNLAHYGRIFHLNELKNLPNESLNYSGYVVESLEAAIYCLINTDSLEECLLKVVNNGNDSDTVAAIAGGLAGLYYGYESIPAEWLDAIIKREWIEQMITCCCMNVM